MAVALLVGCETPVVPGLPDPYEFRLTIDQPNRPAADRTFHWPIGSDVRIYLTEPESPGRPSMRTALRRAITVWNEAAVFGEVRLSETEDLGAAGAVVRWSDGRGVLSTPLTCLGPVAGAASTRGCLTDDQEALRTWPRRDGEPSQVLFRVFVEPTFDQDLLNRVVTHEIGHVIGILRHSDQSEDLMSAGPLTTDRLTPRDRSTLRALYQTPVDLPPEGAGG